MPQGRIWQDEDIVSDLLINTNVLNILINKEYVLHKFMTTIVLPNIIFYSCICKDNYVACIYQ